MLWSGDCGFCVYILGFHHPVLGIVGLVSKSWSGGCRFSFYGPSRSAWSQDCGFSVHTLACRLSVHTLVCRFNVHTLVSGFSVHALVCMLSVHTLVCGFSVHTGVCRFSVHTLVSGFSVHTLVCGFSVHTLVCRFSVHTLFSGFSVHTLVCGFSVHTLVCGFSVHTLVCGFSVHTLVSGLSVHTLVSGFSVHTLLCGLSVYSPSDETETRVSARKKIVVLAKVATNVWDVLDKTMRLSGLSLSWLAFVGKSDPNIPSEHCRTNHAAKESKGGGNVAQSEGRKCSSVGCTSDRHAAVVGSTPWCGKELFSQSQLSVRLSLGVRQPPCVLACINIYAHVKDPKHWQPYHCLDTRKYCTI